MSRTAFLAGIPFGLRPVAYFAVGGAGAPLPAYCSRHVAVSGRLWQQSAAELADDELLARVLELRWTDPSSVVALAPRDRNLQNKARLARVPYRDVEDDI